MSDQNQPAIAIRSTEDAVAFWQLPLAPVDLLLDALGLPRSSFYAVKGEVGIRTFKIGRRVYCRPKEVRDALDRFCERTT